MPNLHAFLIVVIAALVTIGLRFLPFLIFRENRKTPPMIQHLGQVLPCSIMGMLVVYCLKDTEVLTGNHGVPEVIATVFIVVVHRIKKNVLLSIAGGTLLYMAMVQYIFI